MEDKVEDVIEFDRRNIVGWGPTGTVVLRGTIGGKPVAVKRFLAAQSKVIDDQFNLFRTSSNHDSLLRFYSVFSNRGFTYLALELCKYNLSDYISGRYNGPQTLTRDILQQTTHAVAYLHSIGAVHRNLKPTNVLLAVSESGQAVVKLSDFGILSVSGGKWPGGDGSEGWQAPELIKSAATAGPPADIFALGCLYYSVLTGGQHPFGPLPYFRDQKALAGQYDLDALSEKMPVANILIECMIHRSPEYRPSIDEVMAQSNFWSLDFP